MIAVDRFNAVDRSAQTYLVGAGVASLAAAVFLIRDHLMPFNTSPFMTRGEGGGRCWRPPAQTRLVETIWSSRSSPKLIGASLIDSRRAGLGGNGDGASTLDCDRGGRLCVRLRQGPRLQAARFRLSQAGLAAASLE
jgi:hypothetical protein